MTGGLASEYYGLEVKQNTREGTTAISCRKYIENTMAKLKITTRYQRTPMEAELTLPRPQTPCSDKTLHKRYRSLVGSAMHPAVTCRPDIATAVRELSSFLQHPGKQHVQAAERGLQYLHSTTRHHDLTFLRTRDATKAYLPRFMGAVTPPTMLLTEPKESLDGRTS